MDFILIGKYLDGNASEAEVEEVFEWIDASPENRSSFIEYKKIWALTARSLHNENKEWSGIRNRISGNGSVRRLYLTWMKYAAMLIVALGLGMGFQYFLFNRTGQPDLAYVAQNRVQAPWGQMTNVTLPDGTVVVLNSGSSIAYGGLYASGDRTVALEGEAYFEVAKDAEHPFTVKTNSFDLRVYGTSFNVEAYPDDKWINTTLIEGSLGLVSKKGQEMVRLVPGENAKFNKSDRSLSVKHVDTDMYASWKDGVITFRNERLEDIARKIERWYNVEIIIRNKHLKDKPYWGTILKNKPVDQILEVIKLTAAVDYEIISRADKPNLIYWD